MPKTPGTDMGDPQRPLSLLDIEEQLWRDADGSYRAAVDGMLAAIEQRVADALRTLLPPAEHQRCTALAAGVAAARQVLSVSCRPERC